MTKLAVVLDTNIYISAIISNGNPGKLINLIFEKKLRAFTSPTILLELSQKLHQKFNWSETKVNHTLKTLTKAITVIQPSITVTAVRKDPSDNKILACADAANADYIITGDSHLLNLKRFKATKILTPTYFLKIFHPRSPRT